MTNLSHNVYYEAEISNPLEYAVKAYRLKNLDTYLEKVVCILFKATIHEKMDYNTYHQVCAWLTKANIALSKMRETPLEKINETITIN